MKLEEMVGKRMTEAQFDEAAGKKDACYHKVKARYDVWPSAYASGALVKCRKAGAANWGNSKKEVAEGTTQKFKSAVIDKAVKIAKSMGGNMTAAVKKIEKIEKNLSKNGRVEYALQQANEVLGEVSDAQKRKIYKKAFGKEYDDPKRRQSPLPLDIAYKTALNRLKKKEGVNEKKGDFLNSLFPKAKVDKAVKIAKSMSGNMTGAVKKIEKMFKGMSKHTKVKDALQQANEGLDDLKALPKDLKKSINKKRNEGLADKISKNLSKYNKRAKKSRDAMKKYAKVKKKESVDEARGTCWVGYQQKGMKDKGGKMVPNCVKEITEIFYEVDGKGYGYTFEHINDGKLNEAEYQGRKVKLGKPMQGDSKKFKVYVKNPKGNVVKVNFGQGGDAKGGTMKIRKSNPGARKSFRARHNCDSPGPRHKARYWSCRKW